MWAVIISDKEVTMEVIAKELAARGWVLVGRDIQRHETLEEAPRPRLVWMLFNVDTGTWKACINNDKMVRPWYVKMTRNVNTPKARAGRPAGTAENEKA